MEVLLSSAPWSNVGLRLVAKGQRPKAIEETEALIYILVQKYGYLQVRHIYRSTSEGVQITTELKCRAADSVPTETDLDGTRLVLSSADYNLSWGVLTHKRS